MEHHEFLKILNDAQKGLKNLEIFLIRKADVFKEAGLNVASDTAMYAAETLSKHLNCMNDAESKWVHNVIDESWKASDKTLEALLNLAQPGQAFSKIEEGRAAKDWMWNKARSLDKNLPDDATVHDCEKVISKNIVRLKDSDCTCHGDHNGMVTNPDCALHGRG